MTTYATLLTSLGQELHEPNDDAVIDRQIVSALRHLRGKRFLFSDKTVTIDLIDSQETYELGVDLPGDIMSIDSVVQTQSSSYESQLHQISIQDYRRMNMNGTAVVAYPKYWAFFNNKLFLYPAPVDGLSLIIDYQVDPTRDEATGAEITVSATGTETNEFFRRGEELLRTRVCYTYYLQRSADPNSATRAKLLFDEAMASLMHERDAFELAGQVVKGWI